MRNELGHRLTVAPTRPVRQFVELGSLGKNLRHE